MSDLHRQVLRLALDRVQVLDRQIEELNQLAAKALKVHEQAVIRLAAVPGFAADAAQQFIADVATDAAAFETAAQFISWAGLCPGSEVSAEKNKNSKCAKGNRFVRRILNQAAHGAIKTKGLFSPGCLPPSVPPSRLQRSRYGCGPPAGTYRMEDSS